MKTEELITFLASGNDPVERHAAARLYALALTAGVCAAALLMLGLLGVRPDLVEAIRLPMFWIKLGFVAGLLCGSLLMSLRLSHPGKRLDGVPVVLAVPVVAMWGLACLELASAESEQGMALFLGETWRVCPALIAMLSVPIFLGVFWAMRGLAPTRLPLAGFASGLLAGSTGALVYCLHCPEMAAPFLGTWYLLGILTPAVVGLGCGRWILRW